MNRSSHSTGCLHFWCWTQRLSLSAGEGSAFDLFPGETFLPTRGRGRTVPSRSWNSTCWFASGVCESSVWRVARDTWRIHQCTNRSPPCTRRGPNIFFSSTKVTLKQWTISGRKGSMRLVQYWIRAVCLLSGFDEWGVHSREGWCHQIPHPHWGTRFLNCGKWTLPITDRTWNCSFVVRFWTSCWKETFSVTFLQVGPGPQVLPAAENSLLDGSGCPKHLAWYQDLHIVSRLFTSGFE